MAHPDRSVHEIRVRFLEGLKQGMPPSALRRFVLLGARPDESASSRRKRMVD